jgi:hypothetical protein
MFWLEPRPALDEERLQLVAEVVRVAKYRPVSKELFGADLLKNALFHGDLPFCRLLLEARARIDLTWGKEFSISQSELEDAVKADNEEDFHTLSKRFREHLQTKQSRSALGTEKPQPG